MGSNDQMAGSCKTLRSEYDRLAAVGADIHDLRSSWGKVPKCQIVRLAGASSSTVPPSHQGDGDPRRFESGDMTPGSEELESRARTHGSESCSHRGIRLAPNGYHLRGTRSPSLRRDITPLLTTRRGTSCPGQQCPSAELAVPIPEAPILELAGRRRSSNRFPGADFDLKWWSVFSWWRARRTAARSDLILYPYVTAIPRCATTVHLRRLSQGGRHGAQRDPRRADANAGPVGKNRPSPGKPLDHQRARNRRRPTPVGRRQRPK